MEHVSEFCKPCHRFPVEIAPRLSLAEFPAGSLDFSLDLADSGECPCRKLCKRIGIKAGTVCGCLSDHPGIGILAAVHGGQLRYESPQAAGFLQQCGRLLIHRPGGTCDVHHAKLLESLQKCLLTF